MSYFSLPRQFRVKLFSRSFTFPTANSEEEIKISLFSPSDFDFLVGRSIDRSVSGRSVTSSVFLIGKFRVFGSFEMPSGFGEATSLRPESSSGTSSNNGDAGNFECNICFDLAQDPIVTLCGHLFCWPCLYKWLHIHSHSQECPVCKALVEEQKLVPLYGRGKNSTDPRFKSIPGVEIPHRPAGQRPETAPPPNTNHFAQQGFGFMGGFAPAATVRFGNFAFSAGFGGLVPSLFNVHVHGFHGSTMYGGAPSFPYGYSGTFHGGHSPGFTHRRTSQEEQADFSLKLLCLVVLFCVLIALLWP